MKILVVTSLLVTTMLGFAPSNQQHRPDGEMLVNSGCRGLTLEIGKYKFPTHLVVLPSQGLDVILGMDWMTTNGGVIDCVNRSITLTTPEGRRIRYKSRIEPKDIRLNHLKGVSLNHLKEVSLDQVSIVKEYPDVFPDELPGMPPDTALRSAESPSP